MGSSSQCYCAFCGHKKLIVTKKHINALDVFAAVSLGLGFMAVIGDGFDPRGFGVAGVLLAITEVFAVVRHRMSLKCSRCGFDPLIYRRSPEEAAKIVKTHMAIRNQSPQGLLGEPVRPYRYRSGHPDAPQQQ